MIDIQEFRTTLHILMNIDCSIKSLYYWKTVLNPGGDGENATYFQKQEALQVNQGNVVVNVAINSITTLTTFNRGFKGNPIIPPTKPFPLPYADNFEAYNISSLPKYVSSMNGAFEVTADGDNKILQQTVAKQVCIYGIIICSERIMF